MAVVAAAFLCFGSDASAQKTTKLFNGKDLSGWNFVVDKNSVPAEQVYSVKDGVITVYINGVYQNTGTNKVKEGYIGLQSEGKEVQFRNVTITPW